MIYRVNLESKIVAKQPEIYVQTHLDGVAKISRIKQFFLALIATTITTTSTTTASSSSDSSFCFLA